MKSESATSMLLVYYRYAHICMYSNTIVYIERQERCECIQKFDSLINLKYCHHQNSLCVLQILSSPQTIQEKCGQVGLPLQVSALWENVSETQSATKA